jgi:MFS transporter, ACS family, solute carrier family 17 (sodium-dependent inorganic phosphate cotransporter), other
MAEWQYVFGIGALVYIIPAIVFIIFGSGEVQKWNEKKDADNVVQAT